MKIPDVKAVTFEAADPPEDPNTPKAKGARKVTVFADRVDVTKDDAVKALGKKATRYVVKSWTAPAADDTGETEEPEEG